MLAAHHSIARKGREEKAWLTKHAKRSIGFSGNELCETGTHHRNTTRHRDHQDDEVGRARGTRIEERKRTPHHTTSCRNSNNRLARPHSQNDEHGPPLISSEDVPARTTGACMSERRHRAPLSETNDTRDRRFVTTSNGKRET